MKEMSFKSGVKGRGSDRWWEQRCTHFPPCQIHLNTLLC